MGVVKLSSAGILDYQKYGSMLAGNTPFSPSAFDLLETQVLSSSAASVTFTGLGSYSDYKHLQIRMVVRSANTGTSINGYLQLNGDTGSNYSRHLLYGNGSSVASLASTSTSKPVWGQFPGNSATTNAFGAFVMDILDFSSGSKNTTIRTFGGRADSGNGIWFSSNAWYNTSAVTSILLADTEGSPNWLAGSRFSIYGVK